MSTPPNRASRFNSGMDRSREWFKDQFDNHTFRTVGAVSVIAAFAAGFGVASGIESGGSSNQPSGSIDTCPPGYVAQSAGTAGAAIRRFGRAEAELNTRISLLSQNNGNADTLIKILDTFGDTSVHDLGSFVCQGFTANNQPKMMLSPHTETVLGELEGIGIYVPPYTHQ